MILFVGCIVPRLFADSANTLFLFLFRSWLRRLSTVLAAWTWTRARICAFLPNTDTITRGIGARYILRIMNTRPGTHWLKNVSNHAKSKCQPLWCAKKFGKQVSVFVVSNLPVSFETVRILFYPRLRWPDRSQVLFYLSFCLSFMCLSKPALHALSLIDSMQCACVRHDRFSQGLYGIFLKNWEFPKKLHRGAICKSSKNKKHTLLYLNVILLMG